MSLTNRDVCRLFFEGKKDYVQNGRKSLYFYRDTIYSYGQHFPLTIRNDAESNHKSGKVWYLINGDKYSVTTSHHQSLMLWNAPPEQVITSFRGLHLAGLINRDDSLGIFLLDSTPDNWVELPNGKSAGLGYSPVFKGSKETFHWHRPGYALLRKENKRYLCGMDEGSYFISHLSCESQTCNEALANLRPKIIEDKESLRQGEWFFVPTPSPNTKYPGVLADRDYVLSRRNDRGNLHVASWGFTFLNRTFVKGRIFHRASSTGTRSGEHRQVKLESGIWYEAIQNTSLMNWSSQGKVD